MKKTLVFAAAALFSVSAHAFYYPLLVTNVTFLSDDGQPNFFQYFTIQGEVLAGQSAPVGTEFVTEVRVQCGRPGSDADYRAECEDFQFYAEFQEFLPPFTAVLCVGPQDEFGVDDVWMAEGYATVPDGLDWVRNCWTQ